MNTLTTARVTISLFEGQNAISHAGMAYIQRDKGDDEKAYIRLPLRNKRVENRDDENISLRIVESGRTIYNETIENSGLSIYDSPLVFVPKEDSDHWQLIAQASCVTKAKQVRVRMPEGFNVIQGDYQLISSTKESCWIESKSDLLLTSQSDRYSIKLNTQGQMPVFSMANACYYPSSCRQLFLGFPTVKNITGVYSHTINRKVYKDLHDLNMSGLLWYTLKNEDGETLLRRRIGILPKGFSISAMPAKENTPARITLRNVADLHIHVPEKHFTARVYTNGCNKVIELKHNKTETPSNVRLTLCSDGTLEPVTLEHPYPYQGVRLLDSNYQEIKDTAIVSGQLLGMQLQLSSGLPGHQTFELMFALKSARTSSKRQLEHQYLILCKEPIETLSLLSYQSDINRLLGSIADQDATVEFSVSLNQKTLLRKTIKRFNGSINVLRGQIYHINSTKKEKIISAEVMNLTIPEDTPKKLGSRPLVDFASTLNAPEKTRGFRRLADEK